MNTPKEYQLTASRDFSDKDINPIDFFVNEQELPQVLNFLQKQAFEIKIESLMSAPR